jgi:hypothetical protein
MRSVCERGLPFENENEPMATVPDEMEGGHLPALHSRMELVERLENYRTHEEARDEHHVSR